MTPERTVEKLEAELTTVKKELEDYKNCYNAAKSGLRKDEEHCACAYELQAKLSLAMKIVEAIRRFLPEKEPIHQIGWRERALWDALHSFDQSQSEEGKA